MESILREQSLRARFLPSWERILWKLPELTVQMVEALEQDKRRFRELGE